MANGPDSFLWPVFFDIERDLLRKVAFFPTLGNHERNHRSFYDVFDVSGTPYYSFNWGTSHFTVLDSDITSISKNEAVQEAFWSKQVRWLDEDLKKSQSAPGSSTIEFLDLTGSEFAPARAQSGPRPLPRVIYGPLTAAALCD